MRKVQLGKSGSNVSQICLGCLNFGTRNNTEVSYGLLDRYLDAGGSFLDTSNNYAFWSEAGVGGQSETLLGEWMKERGNRDRIFLATKVGANPTYKGGGFDAKEGLSVAAIMKAVDESLTRLQTDYIDLYYAHIDDMSTPLEETIEAFDRLVKAGKVRTLGCSNHYTYRLERAKAIALANGWTPYSCIQQRYTYLRPKPGADFDVQISVSDEMLQYCSSHDDVTLLSYSPLLNGSYTRSDRELPQQYTGADAEARIRVLKEVAEETGATSNQVILAWMIQSKPPVIPVIAASTVEQLQENLDALEVVLSPEQLQRLNAASAI